MRNRETFIPHEIQGGTIERYTEYTISSRFDSLRSLRMNAGEKSQNIYQARHPISDLWLLKVMYAMMGSYQAMVPGFLTPHGSFENDN